MVIFQPAVLVYWRVDAFHLEPCPWNPHFAAFFGTLCPSETFPRFSGWCGPRCLCGTSVRKHFGAPLLFSWQHHAFLPMDCQNFMHTKTGNLKQLSQNAIEIELSIGFWLFLSHGQVQVLPIFPTKSPKKKSQKKSPWKINPKTSNPVA